MQLLQSGTPKRMSIMATSKKPRKKYVRKPVIRPFNIRDPWLTEGDALAAMIALDAGVLGQSHLNMLVAHADMVRRFGKNVEEVKQAETIIRMCHIINQRQDKHVTKYEELPIRAAIKVTLQALQKASNREVFDAARASMHDIEKHGGIILSI